MDNGSVLQWFLSLPNRISQIAVSLYQTRSRHFVAVISVVVLGGSMIYLLYFIWRRLTLTTRARDTQRQPSHAQIQNKVPPTPYSRLRSISNSKVTCSTIGVIFESNQSPIRLIPEAIPILIDLVQRSDLYLITRCNSDAIEREVLKVLEDAKLFENGLNRHKVLFCETSLGKGSIVRQLDPKLHIDDELNILTSLIPYIPKLALINAATIQPQQSNIILAPSLDVYFKKSDSDSNK